MFSDQASLSCLAFGGSSSVSDGFRLANSGGEKSEIFDSLQTCSFSFVQLFRRIVEGVEN